MKAVMNVLVTGASGFLGRYIVDRLLARGDRVRALCRRPDRELSRRGVEICYGDVRDREGVRDACRQMQMVMHTAGIAGIWGPWSTYYDVNTVGTRNVVAGCLAHHVSTLVYTSSPSVTFEGRPQTGIDESVPYARRWLCHYPHSKALAEQHVLAAHGRNGLATCALRPHLIWGPGDRHLVPRLLDRARRGRLRRVGDGRNEIDMVYVENAADAHLQAADALRQTDGAAGGRAYYISQGQPVNCWDWINQILALAGLGPVGKAISLKTAWRLGSVLEGIYGALRLRAEPPMTRFLAAQLGMSHYFDIGAARRDFGYNPQISTRDGMQKLAAALGNQTAEDGPC